VGHVAELNVMVEKPRRSFNKQESNGYHPSQLNGYHPSRSHRRAPNKSKSIELSKGMFKDSELKKKRVSGLLFSLHPRFFFPTSKEDLKFKEVKPFHASLTICYDFNT
jgi:hypothetical protein